MSDQGVLVDHDGRDVPCAQCGGPLGLLGNLGLKTWARCRNCGWDAVIDLAEAEVAA